VGEVLVIIAVPADTPCTVPPTLTVATAVLLLPHVEPETELLNEILLPVQTEYVLPEMLGNVPTVTVTMLLQPPGNV
jgi:hypothetical protein